MAHDKQIGFGRDESVTTAETTYYRCHRETNNKVRPLTVFIANTLQIFLDILRILS